MEYLIETVSPAKAKSYLETSEGNRPLSKAAVRSYSDTMKQGKWMLNGIPIIFDTGGHLIDGHHRLEAIVQAGIPVTMNVCRGVQKEAFTTFDCGLHRNLGQLLAMQGIPNYNTVASVVSTNTNLVRCGRILANNGKQHGRVTNNDFYENYSRDPKDFQEAAVFGRYMYAVARIMKAAWVGGLYYYLSHTGSYDKDYVRSFFSSVCNLQTSDINSADKLREYILTNDRKNESMRMRTDHLFAIVVKAWNAYVTNKVVNRYNFNAEKEDYPKLILNCE